MNTTDQSARCSRCDPCNPWIQQFVGLVFSWPQGATLEEFRIAASARWRCLQVVKIHVLTGVVCVLCRVQQHARTHSQDVCVSLQVAGPAMSLCVTVTRGLTDRASHVLCLTLQKMHVQPTINALSKRCQVMMNLHAMWPDGSSL